MRAYVVDLKVPDIPVLGAPGHGLGVLAVVVGGGPVQDVAIDDLLEVAVAGKTQILLVGIQDLPRRVDDHVAGVGRFDQRPVPAFALDEMVFHEPARRDVLVIDDDAPDARVGRQIRGHSLDRA